MNTKFNINDDVYAIATEYETKSVTCEFCEGAGEVYIESETNFPFMVNGKKIKICPICKGTTEVIVRMLPWRISLIKIDFITIEENKITYSEDNYLNEYLESEVFATETEAKKECDRRNFGVI